MVAGYRRPTPPVAGLALIFPAIRLIRAGDTGAADGNLSARALENQNFLARRAGFAAIGSSSTTGDRSNEFVSWLDHFRLPEEVPVPETYAALREEEEALEQQMRDSGQVVPSPVVAVPSPSPPSLQVSGQAPANPPRPNSAETKSQSAAHSSTSDRMERPPAQAGAPLAQPHSGYARVAESATPVLPSGDEVSSQKAEEHSRSREGAQARFDAPANAAATLAAAATAVGTEEASGLVSEALTPAHGTEKALKSDDKAVARKGLVVSAEEAKSPTAQMLKLPEMPELDNNIQKTQDAIRELELKSPDAPTAGLEAEVRPGKETALTAAAAAEDVLHRLGKRRRQTLDKDVEEHLRRLRRLASSGRQAGASTHPPVAPEASAQVADSPPAELAPVAAQDKDAAQLMAGTATAPEPTPKKNDGPSQVAHPPEEAAPAADAVQDEDTQVLEDMLGELNKLQRSEGIQPRSDGSSSSPFSAQWSMPAGGRIRQRHKTRSGRQRRHHKAQEQPHLDSGRQQFSLQAAMSSRQHEQRQVGQRSRWLRATQQLQGQEGPRADTIQKKPRGTRDLIRQARSRDTKMENAAQNIPKASLFVSQPPPKHQLHLFRPQEAQERELQDQPHGGDQRLQQLQRLQQELELEVDHQTDLQHAQTEQQQPALPVVTPDQTMQQLPNDAALLKLEPVGAQASTTASSQGQTQLPMAAQRKPQQASIMDIPPSFSVSDQRERHLNVDDWVNQVASEFGLSTLLHQNAPEQQPLPVQEEQQQQQQEQMLSFSQQPSLIHESAVLPRLSAPLPANKPLLQQQQELQQRQGPDPYKPLMSSQGAISEHSAETNNLLQRLQEAQDQQQQHDVQAMQQYQQILAQRGHDAFQNRQDVEEKTTEEKEEEKEEEDEEHRDAQQQQQQQQKGTLDRAQLRLKRRAWRAQRNETQARKARWRAMLEQRQQSQAEQLSNSQEDQGQEAEQSGQSQPVSQEEELPERMEEEKPADTIADQESVHQDAQQLQPASEQDQDARPEVDSDQQKLDQEQPDKSVQAGDAETSGDSEQSEDSQETHANALAEFMETRKWLFDQFDKDEDEKLTWHEFHTGNPLLSWKSIENMFNEMDTDKDSVISLNEFDYGKYFWLLGQR